MGATRNDRNICNNICVYRHRRLDTNEIFYIGIGNTKRPYTKKDRSIFWNRVIKKTEYEIEIIAKDLDWDTACELEELLISEYGRKNLNTGTLVNLTNGGEGSQGLIVSQETREKLRQFNLGKIISEEEKQRLRTLGLGRIKSKEERLKLSLAHKGKSKSKEHRLNLSLTHPGKKQVICILTNKIWESVTKCAEENNLCRYCLARKLRGGVKNNTNFKYLN